MPEPEAAARRSSAVQRRFRGIESLRSAERTGTATSRGGTWGTGTALIVLPPPRPAPFARPLCHVRQLNRTPRPIEPILRSVAFHAERFDRGNTLSPSFSNGVFVLLERLACFARSSGCRGYEGESAVRGRLAPIHLPSNGITRNARALCLTCSVRVFVPLERCPRPPRKAE